MQLARCACGKLVTWPDRKPLDPQPVAPVEEVTVGLLVCLCPAKGQP